jgi:hypothetical protein
VLSSAPAKVSQLTELHGFLLADAVRRGCDIDFKRPEILLCTIDISLQNFQPD